MPERENLDRIVNIVPSKGIENDWLIRDALGAGVVSASATPPASKDLREDWWQIGDQGATGSCVGWGTAEGVLRQHFVKAAKIQQNERLSPRFIWMAAKESDEFDDRPSTFIEKEGTSLKAALDIARKFGAVKESVLGFDSNELFQGDENTFYAIAAQLKIASYFNLFKNFSEWRDWLATKGPILVALKVDETWDNATQSKGNLDAFKPDTVRGGHAVSVVGYHEDGRFIIRNSWGTGWGDHGFGFATEEYIQGAFFDEAYGVNL
jgi:hypothetical protein